MKARRELEQVSSNHIQLVQEVEQLQKELTRMTEVEEQLKSEQVTQKMKVEELSTEMKAMKHERDRLSRELEDKTTRDGMLLEQIQVRTYSGFPTENKFRFIFYISYISLLYLFADFPFLYYIRKFLNKVHS